MSGDLQRELEDLFAHYAEVIDDGDLERWPEFFTDPSLYRIVSKENWDKKLPMSLMRCESMGMLKDRAFASQKLNVYGPRAWRHFVSQIRARVEGDRIVARSNFVLYETLIEHQPQVLCLGRYLDVLVRQEGKLLFAERICVYDNAIIPGSIVLPV